MGRHSREAPLGRDSLSSGAGADCSRKCSRFLHSGVSFELGAGRAKCRKYQEKQTPINRAIGPGKRLRTRRSGVRISQGAPF